MNITNFEFKARSIDISLPEEKLLKLDPVFKGEDHQLDTYFNIEKGRLKLREGNIENSLIYYERKDVAGSKQSDVLLYQFEPNPSLKEILIKVHGVKVIVDKTRKIYFVDNVKFHFDTVAGLGTYVEVEAINNNNLPTEKLKDQCNFYANFLGIQPSDFESESYSDLLLKLKKHNSVNK